LASKEKNGTAIGVYWEKLSAYVANHLWAGESPRWIVRDLEARGLRYEIAAALVEAVEEALRTGGAM